MRTHMSEFGGVAAGSRVQELHRTVVIALSWRVESLRVT